MESETTKTKECEIFESIKLSGHFTEIIPNNRMASVQPLTFGRGRISFGPYKGGEAHSNEFDHAF